MVNIIQKPSIVRFSPTFSIKEGKPAGAAADNVRHCSSKVPGERMIKMYNMCSYKCLESGGVIWLGLHFGRREKFLSDIVPTSFIYPPPPPSLLACENHLGLQHGVLGYYSLVFLGWSFAWAKGVGLLVKIWMSFRTFQSGRGRGRGKFPLNQEGSDSTDSFTDYSGESLVNPDRGRRGGHEEKEGTFPLHSTWLHIPSHLRLVRQGVDCAVSGIDVFGRLRIVG